MKTLRLVLSVFVALTGAIPGAGALEIHQEKIPQAVEAPTPQIPQVPSAQAGLTDVSQAIVVEQAQPQAAAPSAASRGFFDRAAKPAAAAVVIGAAAAVHPALTPAAYALTRFVQTPKAPKTEPGSVRERALDAAESHAHFAIPYLGAVIGSAAAGNHWSFPFILGAVSFAASTAGENSLASLRKKIVGGWQASHDQKYRHNGQGQLVNVRGHAYGKDRYEEYAQGTVSRGEKLWLRALASGLGALWLHGDYRTALIYGLTLTGLYLLSDLRAKPKNA